MRVAALDLGTNTFLLLVAEVENGRLVRVVHDEVRVVRLGQGVNQTRSFHPEALERARECLQDYAKTLRSLGAKKVLACATSAARDVTNGCELIAIAEECGIPIEIISGEREAELTYRGTISDDLQPPVSIIDVGGGSTEFIFGDRRGIQSRLSLDIGSVRLTEKFVSAHPIPQSEMNEMAAFILGELEKVKWARPKETPGSVAIAVAGTPTTLATLDQGLPFESERVHGHILAASRLKYWVERLAGLTIPERQALAGMEPKRADVIVAGAFILMLSTECLGVEALEVSVRGLRYGVARELGE